MCKPRPIIPRVLVLFLFLVSAGCGGTNWIPVEGQVTVGGEPLRTGTITFHPDTSKGNKQKYSALPLGSIDNGKYTLSMGGKPGAPPGWYKVTVRSSVPSNSKDPYSVPKLTIEATNASVETTTLSIEVKPGAPAGTYDLKLAK
jgi:hypothetical protein